MCGIGDCGGPVEGAEEGHERSSIVSVEAASAGFHLTGRSQLINANPLEDCSRISRGVVVC